MWKIITPILVVAVLVGGYVAWKRGPASSGTSTEEGMTQGNTVDAAVSFYLDGGSEETSATGNDEANAADATANSDVSADFGQVYSTNDF